MLIPDGYAKTIDLREPIDGSDLIINTSDLYTAEILPNSAYEKWEDRELYRALDEIAYKKETQASSTRIRDIDLVESAIIVGNEKLETDGDRYKIPDGYGFLSETSKSSAELTALRLGAIAILNNCTRQKSAVDKFLDTLRGFRADGGSAIGYVVFSPSPRLPLFGKMYSRDIAVVQLFNNKVNPGNFLHNYIDFQQYSSMTNIPDIRAMYKQDSKAYPSNNRLQIKGFIDPQRYKEKIAVIKAGFKTGVTVGMANPIMAHVDMLLVGQVSDDVEGKPKETIRNKIDEYYWSIPLQRNNLFSEPGDSGSLVADLEGRWSGLLIAGNGEDDTNMDFSYALPAYVINAMLKQSGFRDIVLP